MMIDDTERVDFLADLWSMMWVLAGDEKAGYVVWDQSNGLTMVSEGKTAREAIDLAINASRKHRGLHRS